MTSENITIGKRIMALRKAAGMTQEQLADKLGVSPQAVSKWENDISCPDISTIPIIASIFNVSSDELLGIAEDIPVSAKEPSIKKGSSHNSGMGFGILLIVLGASFLISRTVELPFSIWDIVWPAALLGVGISWTVRSRSVFCLGIAAVGLVYLLSALGNPLPAWINWDIIWPLGLLLIGLDIVLHKLCPSIFGRMIYIPGAHRYDGNSVSKHCLQNGFISSETVFGEKHYCEENYEITGGNIETTFGQCTMDLSRCTFSANTELTVEVTFGRLQLILPTSVRAESRVESAFGSVNISGTPSSNAIPVILSGSSAFASLEVSYR